MGNLDPTDRIDLNQVTLENKSSVVGELVDQAEQSSKDNTYYQVFFCLSHLKPCKTCLLYV